MEELRERMNKLKENDLADFMEDANEQFSKHKSSKRNEIEEMYNEIKRRIRNAKMHTTNEERAISMQTDILQNRIAADEKKKKEYEKELEERRAGNDFLIKDIESQKMLSRENELIQARENFLKTDTDFAKRLQEYASKEHLRNELLKLCAENGAALIDSENCDEYYAFLIERADVEPISFSRKGSYEEVINNAKKSVQYLLSSKN